MANIALDLELRDVLAAKLNRKPDWMRGDLANALMHTNRIESLLRQRVAWDMSAGDVFTAVSPAWAAAKLGIIELWRTWRTYENIGNWLADLSVQGKPVEMADGWRNSADKFGLYRTVEYLAITAHEADQHAVPILKWAKSTHRVYRERQEYQLDQSNLNLGGI